MFLNAKSVKISRNIESSLNNNINSTVKVPVNNLNVNSSVEYQRKEENMNEVRNKMVFSQKNNDIKLEELYNDNYFFLPKQNKPACSKNFTIEDQRTMLIRFF